MKTLTVYLSACTLVTVLTAADPSKAPCCAGEPPAPAAVVHPLSALSLYQLEAEWTDDAGRSLHLAALRGQPVIVALFFTHCEYACPMIVADISRARELLPAEARAKTRIVLVSFDAARDTPGTLKAYRERAGLDASWTLLHGNAAAVQDLAMLLGVKYKADTRGQFSHSNLVTVLNTKGEIAYQRAGLQGDMSDLAHAVVLAAK